MNQQKKITVPAVSLAEGGVSERIFQRVIGIRSLDPREYARFALILALATWVPLVLLSMLGGVALPGSVAAPFFHEITPHVRFLFALPLLIVADLIVGPRLAGVVSQFVESGLVTDATLPEFEAIAKGAIRLRDSKLAELIVLVIAYLTTALNVRRELETGVSSWLAIEGHLTLNLTLAGWWYVLFSVPIYQFFLFRWFMRLCNWAVFLFRVSFLDLQIIPTHPDGVAGLGFVGGALAPLRIILLAASAVLCSSIGTQVLYRGAKLEDFPRSFVGFVLVAIFAFVVPFAMFAPKLAAAKRKGKIEYGALATRYSQLFDRKWIRSEEAVDEELLGSADIQSLADLGNSFDRVANMKLLPIGLTDLRALLVALLLPAIPLVLTQFSAKDVMQIVTKVLF